MADREYKIDKTFLTGITFEEAGNHVSYLNNKTEPERLNAACYLINQLYGVTQYTKVDFSVTDKRKNS